MTNENTSSSSETQRQAKSMPADQPLSYWIALACIGFEEDLYRLMEATEPQMNKSDLARAIGTSPQYVSKLFNGNANYTLETMAKLGRAVKAILQVRLVLEGKEVVRIVDYETAAILDDQVSREPRESASSSSTAESETALDNVLPFRAPGTRASAPSNVATG